MLSDHVLLKWSQTKKELTLVPLKNGHALNVPSNFGEKAKKLMHGMPEEGILANTGIRVSAIEQSDLKKHT